MEKKIIYKDAKKLYGHSMSQPLPYDEIEFVKNVKIKDIKNTPDDSDIGYFIEFDITYPDNLRENKKFPICS